MELLVVIAIILLLIGILLPSLRAAREVSYRAACSGNIREIIRAAQAYAADAKFNRGEPDALPMVDVGPGNWHVAREGEGNAGCFWLLIEKELATSKSFVCPATDKAPGEKGDEHFTDDTLSYSFHSMVSPSGEAPGVRSILSQLETNIVFVADANPRTRIGSSSVSGSDNENSENHDGDGQVIGRLNQSAEFVDTTKPDEDDDSIYGAEGGSESAGRPGSMTDSFLIP